MPDSKRARDLERALDILEPILAPRLADGDRFLVLAAASFLEGTLRFPGGATVRFEWDADDKNGLTLRALLDDLMQTEVAKQKARAAIGRGEL